jgi:serine/threonine-protein kinase
LLFEDALLAGALLVTATLSGLTAMRVVLTSQEVVVPALIQMKTPEAGALVAERRLLLRVEGKRHDPQVPRDGIVAQDPTAGTPLKAHRSVKVWVSLGPRRLDVPALQGESLRTARLKLQQMQIPVAHIAEARDPAEAGTILLQAPAPGEADSVGEGVELLVSLGPPPFDYVMPDLIGRQVEEAEATLKRAGLRTGDVRYRNYPGVPAGTVLRHLPAAGHRVNGQTPVAFEICRPS